MAVKNDGGNQVTSTKKYYLYFSLFFLVQFVVTMIILFTDHNLQTDFGTVPKYFLHWYGLLITGIADLLAFALLLFVNRRQFMMIGIIWSAFMAIFQVADIATYGTLNVGLTASKFATYLFGLGKYPGARPYIPGLYDLLFAIYLIALGFGIYLYRKLPKQTVKNEEKKAEQK